MQMQELEIFRIFGEEKAFLTESIKTLNGKSCSPQVITATIGSFICGNSFFVHGQEEKKKGRGRVGLRFMGRVVLPPKYWHSTSPVLWRQKSSPTPPNIDIPAWLFYCRTHWWGRCRLLGIVWISTPWWVSTRNNCIIVFIFVNGKL